MKKVCYKVILILLFSTILYSHSEMIPISCKKEISSKCTFNGYSVGSKYIGEQDYYKVDYFIDEINKSNYDEFATLSIIGYIDDNEMKNSKNKNLGYYRSIEIKKLLLSRGLNKDINIFVKRNKDNKYISENETKEGRYNNRRVEIVLSGFDWSKIRVSPSEYAYPYGYMKKNNQTNNKYFCEDDDKKCFIRGYDSGELKLSDKDIKEYIYMFQKYSNKNKYTIIRLKGFMDKSELITNEKGLGRKRAEYVKEALLENGFEKNNFHIVVDENYNNEAYDKNDTKKEQYNNSRVEVTLESYETENDFLLNKDKMRIMLDGGPNCLASKKICTVRGFGINKENFWKEESRDIEDLISILNSFYTEGSEIHIIGNTDTEESELEQNKSLGLKRAENIKNFLLENGLDKNIKILISSKEDTNPSDTNDTNEGRYNNRRVSIVLNGFDYSKPVYYGF